MSDHPHALGAYVSKEKLEKVGDAFIVDGLYQAREKTIEVFDEIKSRLVAGMTEDEGRKLALAVFAEHGVKKHWHRPYVRFAQGTALTFNEPDATDWKLRSGDPVYLDLGPVWADERSGIEYEGDFGEGFIFDGQNTEAQRCIAATKALFLEAQAKYKAEKLSGIAIYEFLGERAKTLGYVLHSGVLGHRVADFPHQKYAKERLSDAAFYPAQALWVLEVHLADSQGRFGAFYEDLL